MSISVKLPTRIAAIDREDAAPQSVNRHGRDPNAIGAMDRAAMETHERLDAHREELAAKGADEVRLEIVRRARNFKRSWVEMAEALMQVKNRNMHLDWGYEDFHSYCQLELLLTKATVDKLTGRFAVVQEHAPQVLARDGVAQPIPSMGAVDYFAKALRGAPENDAEEDESWDDLKQAVFDDNQSVAVLRKSFDPIFFAKSEEDEAVENLEKARTAIRRLEGILQRVAGVDDTKLEVAMRALADLREDVDQAIPEAKAHVDARRAS